MLFRCAECRRLQARAAGLPRGARGNLRPGRNPPAGPLTPPPPPPPPRSLVIIATLGVPTLLSKTVAAPIQLVAAAKSAFRTARSGPAAVIDVGALEAEGGDGSDLHKGGAGSADGLQADAALAPAAAAAAAPAAGLITEASSMGELEVLPDEAHGAQDDAPYTL